MTRSTLVTVTRGQDDSSLQYHLLPLDGVRVFAYCVHYKKLVIYTATNEMYQMVLMPHGQLAEDWDQWTRAAKYLERGAVDIKESRGVRGSFKIGQQDKNPLLEVSLENMDICPFYQNSFQNWLKKTQYKGTTEPKQT